MAVIFRVLFFFAASIFAAAASERKITTVLNPNCTQCDQKHDNSFVNLVYSYSVGAHDTLHHVWSTIGRPSFLLLQTSTDVPLDFNWKQDSIYPDITCNENISYAFGLVFNKVWEYSDPKDDGTMDGRVTDMSSTDFESFFWNNVTLTNSEDQATAVFQSVNQTGFFIDDGGSLSLKVDIQGDTGRNDDIPRLLYNSNSSQVRLILDNLLPHSETSRFAVELSIFATEKVTDQDLFSTKTVKTMDDEYTPGVFKAEHLISGQSHESMSGSFVSWKPVAYTSDDLSVTDSTSSISYKTVPTTLSDQSLSVVKMFFDSSHLDVPQGVLFNMSFGNSKDGYYTATNYTQWSFSYGLGIPDDDQLSSLVIGVIASGLGLPLLLIVLSTVYFVWHKMKMRNDDLLLSRQ